MTDVDEVTQLYPQCTQPGVNLAKTFVAVHAAVKGNGLEYGSAVRLTFGMALWVAIVIHVIGVEIYVRITRTVFGHFPRGSNTLKSSFSRFERLNLRISTDGDSCWRKMLRMCLTEKAQWVIARLTCMICTFRRSRAVMV